MAGVWWQAGRRGVGEVAESFILIHRNQAEKDTGSGTHLMIYLIQGSPCLLILSKQLIKQRLSMPIHESMGAVFIQTTTGYHSYESMEAMFIQMTTVERIGKS